MAENVEIKEEEIQETEDASEEDVVETEVVDAPENQDEDKVKVTLRFRGREMAHQEIGMRQIERIKTDLQELATVEQMPKMEGRQMVMILAPNRKK